ncbi:MAG: hypothetical protein KAS73_12355 [Candidatus Sabulitectum sp.]|nr:hypothetical protein [Candidatus Sabulitectum sp.]
MKLAKALVGHLWDLRIDRSCKIKLKKIKNNLRTSPSICSSATRSEFMELWSPLEHKPDSAYIDVYSKVCGIDSSLFVPENTYYKTIEPTLNNRAFSLAYADKNFYNRFVEGNESTLPDIYLRGINGTVYTSDYMPVLKPEDVSTNLPKEKRMILKPAVDSGGGAGVVGLQHTQDSKISINGEAHDYAKFVDILKNDYENSFVIQERIEQHPWFSSFNKSSVNTIRMMIYRSSSDEKVKVIKSVLRFGQPGSLVDNQASGGLSCGVSKDGIVNDFAVDKYGTIFPQNITEKEVPGYNEMVDLVSNAAKKFPYHRLLGFDMCIDSEGHLKLLEVNTKNLEINFMQMNLGPLFGEYTEEVIQYCSSKKKTIVLDFQT